MPPQSHEVLLVRSDGSATYLTGMPWPDQEPFDEIGIYAADDVPYRRLTDAARAAIAAGSGAQRYADSGGESIAIDGEEASWSPRARSGEAEALLSEMRAVIAIARAQPLAVAHAALGDDQVTLSNRGTRALSVTGGDVRAGWGPADRVASPLNLALARPLAVELPRELASGASVTLPLPSPGTVDDPAFATLNALVHVRWRPEVDGEPDELDGWMVTRRSLS
jgi:hypothetical protein